MTSRLFLSVVLLITGANAQSLFGAINAQRPVGEIRLEVKDPSGKAMEASGKLENLSTGAVKSFRTDGQGKCTFEKLSFGRYRLEIRQEGFATQSFLIDVQTDAPILREVTMAVGSLAFNVEVVAATPLPGVDQERREIPTPVQAATERDIEQSGALDLTDFLNRRLTGVHVNEIQGNPFLADVNYRGYTATALLGTPQGLSVYQDGVRLNQPFGDVVSWDLIPRIAIAEMALMPGSNPLFGLNTLGGALSIQTKDGRTAPGTALELSGGSFGRREVAFEHGAASARGLYWYLAGNLHFEDGWREASPSDVRQFFGKLGWQHANTLVGITLSYANNGLIGNALQEQRFLARDYASAYTKSDSTSNRSPFLNLSARHNFNSTWTLSGNAYYRSIRTNTLNGDLNEDSLDQSVYQPSAADIRALTAAGYTGFPTSGANAVNTPFPFWRCIAQVLQRDEPAEKCTGLLNRSHTEQHNYGVSGQLTWFGSLRGYHNQFTAGAAFDRSSIGFQQSTQLGYINPDLGVTAVNAFADGVTGGEIDGEPFDTRVDLDGRIQTGSVFVTDTLSIGRAWAISLSGRYNRTTINNTDRIRPGGGPGSLDSDNVFDRFNPAIGITYSPSRFVNAYVSYSEGSRAPTSVELGCADPERPCKLPNAMAGDPPLDQVVTRTVEAGLRSGQEGRVNWTLGWFRAENSQDVLFVSSTQTGFGYFKNFGKTLRQGLELDVSSRVGRVSFGGNYTFLDATYQSPETVDGSNNSSNEEAQGGVKGLEGTIQVVPGNRIPLIPQHMFKAFAGWQATSKFLLDAGLVAVSSSYARGNENNLHQPDGQYYLGSGKSPGYAVVNLGARYQLNRRLELFVKINNLLNRRYYTAAQLVTTGFTENHTINARPLPAVNGEFPLVHATFYAPGAPIGAWAGVRLKF